MPRSIKYSFLTSFFLVLLMLTSILSVSAEVQTQGVSEVSRDALREAALNTALASQPQFANRELVVSSIVESGEWASGTVIVRAPRGEHGGPQLMRFLARVDGQGWDVALAADTHFREWLAASPTQLIPAATRELLLSPSREASGGNGDSQLGMPFNVGETWAFNGTHGNGVTREAMDFFYSSGASAGQDGLVRASRAGVVYRDAGCPNYVQVDHADGWSTGYYHLINEAVTNGQSISAGTVVGEQSEATGCGGFAVGDHVHWSLLKDDSAVDLHGMATGGWLFEDGRVSYEGCMVRISDNVRRCNGSGLLNTGIFGNGTTDTTNFWIFNRSLLNWTVTADLSFVGFGGNEVEGAPYWSMTGTNPYFTSPAFSASPASFYDSIFIDMMTENDTCGSVYFLRSTDGAFDESRRVDFTLIPDGESHRYLVDMKQNANWTGNIVRLSLKVGCLPGSTTTTDYVLINRIDLVPMIRAANTELITAGGFGTVDAVNTYWSYRNLWWWLTGGGKFTIGRLNNNSSFPSTLAQLMGGAVPQNTTFTTQIALGNDDTEAHDVIIAMRDADTYDTGVYCQFEIPALSAAQPYTIVGKTSGALRNISFEINLLTQTGDTSPAGINIIVDNVTTKITPGISVTGTDCYPPVLDGPTELMVSGELETPPVLPTFSWEGVESADGYRLFVWTTDKVIVIDEIFDTSICIALSCAVDGAEILPPWGMMSADLEWWVGALFSSGGQAWSGGESYEPATFTVNVPAAELPTNITVNPNRGRPTISWDDDPNTLWMHVWIGTNPWGSYFEWIERDGDPTDNTPDYTCDAGTCSFNPAFDAPGANGAGTLINYTVWMYAWSPGGFSTGGPVPAAPGWNSSDPFNLPTDPAGLPQNIGVQTPQTVDPVIVWDASADATWYQVYITTTTFAPIYGSNASWFSAEELGCLQTTETECVLDGLNIGGSLSAGTAYLIYVQGWGPGGFSTGGLAGAPSWNEGTFTYNPE